MNFKFGILLKAVLNGSKCRNNFDEGHLLTLKSVTAHAQYTSFEFRIQCRFKCSLFIGVNPRKASYSIVKMAGLNVMPLY